MIRLAHSLRRHNRTGARRTGSGAVWFSPFYDCLPAEQRDQHTHQGEKMRKLIVAAVLAWGLSACGFDPVREAVNYQLGGVTIGEAMLGYKAMGRIKINSQEDQGTVSVVGTIDNASYAAEFPTSPMAEIVGNPANHMQVVFYLSHYINDQKEQDLKLDHCAIILDENGKESRFTKQEGPGERQCTKLLQDLKANDSLFPELPERH